MKTLKIGIMSRDEFCRYTTSIAKGEVKPAPDAPKVWFDSVESMAQVLSAKNRQLLYTIQETRPESLGQLARITGRRKESLSRTLSTMAAHGLVKLEKGPRNSLMPVPLADRFEVAAFT